MTTAGAMSHGEAQEQLEAFALDALDGAERAVVAAHVAGCAACRAEVEAIRDDLGTLAHLAAPVAVPADERATMRSRLVARAAADRSGNVTNRMASPASAGDRVRSIDSAPSRRGGGGWMLRAAAAVLLVVMGGALWRTREERDLARTALLARGERATALERENGRLRGELDGTRRMVEALTGPSVAVVDLASDGRAAARARMFWNQATNRWTLVAHNLPKTAEGRTYELWLLTADGAKIPAGTFSPDAGGRAVVEATYELPAASLKAIAVTEEPAGGVPQPTGPIVLVGAAR